MNQLLLPFRNLRVDARHIEWLRLANAGDYPERKFWFYSFKTRFLRRHAVTDGLDLQTIVLKCWCGDGIFRGIDDNRPRKLWEKCHKCGGSGIYLTKHVVLIRWMIGGMIFHEPSNLIPHRPGNDYRNRIDGLIRHEPVSSAVGRRAMLRLFLRYEPDTFLRFHEQRWRSWLYWKGVNLRYNIRRVKLLLSRRQEDEIPF